MNAFRDLNTEDVINLLMRTLIRKPTTKEIESQVGELLCHGGPFEDLLISNNYNNLMKEIVVKMKERCDIRFA